MKRIDFENGTVTGNILGAALPMLVAQILNLLYNIVDRIYIARIPHVGTAALGAVGICFPLVVIITAFANLFGGGGAPLFSIERGKKEEKADDEVQSILAQRAEARAAKDWAKSDELRDRLKDMGYSVKDTPQGQQLTRI